MACNGESLIEGGRVETREGGMGAAVGALNFRFDDVMFK